MTRNKDSLLTTWPAQTTGRCSVKSVSLADLPMHESGLRLMAERFVRAVNQQDIQESLFSLQHQGAA